MNANNQYKIENGKWKIIFLLLPIFSFALNISVTVLPQKGVVKAIAEEKANVYVMVPPGSSPATYSISFKELKNIKNSDVYFTIGVPFDKKYINKIKETNPNIKVVYFGKYLNKEPNPHIWLSPAKLQLEAKVVLDELIKADPKNKEFYLNNYIKYINSLAALEKEGFLNINQKSFITFHPAFYHFSQDFHIKEVALEKEGKEPSFSYLNKVLKTAKENHIKTVIISPEFPKKYAEIIAQKINAKTYVISPLNEDPRYTIKELIKALK
ncbi:MULTISPECIES: metal ABC transporter solute-binding protein, Zn/Mn family [unclassified Lebetimonas]|uniref:metal ABC transporter solute-binding protein, Zn/Mn family n=1 Tax=unclassified Lebetimonas TaxID=2648158 RepID=UPI000465D100|nr:MULTISPECIES: zinc ABC transporter substrate-binding protein [unclassified Lebetimonas]